MRLRESSSTSPSTTHARTRTPSSLRSNSQPPLPSGSRASGARVAAIGSYQRSGPTTVGSGLDAHRRDEADPLRHGAGVERPGVALLAEAEGAPDRSPVELDGADGRR